MARPGDTVDLTMTDASPAEAAEIYPASYWYSLLEVPPASDFPGTGPRGNGIGTAMKTQADETGCADPRTEGLAELSRSGEVH